jgi:hypothetical protein
LYLFGDKVFGKNFLSKIEQNFLLTLQKQNKKIQSFPNFHVKNINKICWKKITCPMGYWDPTTLWSFVNLKRQDMPITGLLNLLVLAASWSTRLMIRFLSCMGNVLRWWTFPIQGARFSYHLTLTCLYHPFFGLFFGHQTHY